VFLVNIFDGKDLVGLAGRLECIAGRRAGGQFDRWVALVTNDFFLRPENLAAVRAAGCAALFCGVESFDAAWNARQNKRQNGVRPQTEIIRECLEARYSPRPDAGRHHATPRQLEAELELILAHPEVPLPGYLSLPIPLPGTPFFYQCLDAELILPHTRVRDLDPTTISLRPLDPLPQVARFVQRLQSMAGYRARIARHSLAFARRYWRPLGPRLLRWCARGAALLWRRSPGAPRRPGASAAAHHTSTAPVPDDFYRPAFNVATRHRHHFTPLMLTDGPATATRSRPTSKRRARAPGAAARPRHGSGPRRDG
jgi:hypothetical protein